jgi:CoA:oxalate CoA-transferase
MPLAIYPSVMDIARGPGPLDGVRVLDLTRVLAGPHCTRMLRDLGAHVIKVEPPDGDGTRLSFPKVASIATYFSQQNCGKENISLDLQQPAGIDLLLQLINHVDIMVENFRPDVMDRLGLSWEVLHERNPRLILASISGYGRGNEWSNRRAYAPVVSAEMGITDLQAKAHHGDVGSDPISHADLYTSLECLSGVLAALYHRERTGTGQWVEVSMAETMLSVNEHMHWILARDLDGVSDDNFVPSYRTQEFPVVTARSGELVLIAGHPAADGNFQPLCLMMQRPDLLDDPSLATVGQRRAGLERINEALSAWAITVDTVDELIALVDSAGFAVGVVRTVTDAATSAWAIERGAIVAIDNRNGGTLRIPNSPIRFSAADAGVRGSVRYRGEDNRSVLRNMLGLTDDQVDELEASGVVSSRLPKVK